MYYFFSTDVLENKIILSREESNHCIKVLRHDVGDIIYVVDGKGMRFISKISKFTLGLNINQDQFTRNMKKEGVLFNSEYGAIRMVTNYGVSSKDIEKVIDITSKVIRTLKK